MHMLKSGESTQFLRTRQFGLLVVGATVLLLLALIELIATFGYTGLLAAAGFGGVLLALYVHPLVMFTLYFSALFFADTSLPGFAQVTANQVLAILFFLSAVSFRVRGHAMKLTSTLLPILGVIALYFSINALTGESLERGPLHFRYLMIYFVMAIFLASCLTGERTILALAWIITILTFFAAVSGMLEAVEKNALASFTGRWGSTVRIKGTAKNAVVYAWGLLFAFPFAFLLFAEMRTTLLRFLALAMGLFTMFIAILTFNRQTIAAIGVVLLLCAFLFRYRNRKTFMAIVLAAAGVGVVTVLPMVLLRLGTVANVRRDVSYLERHDNLLIGLEMFRHHPFFGIGLGSFPVVWRCYIPPDYSTFFAQYFDQSMMRFPDFGYLQLLSETGLVGLALFSGTAIFLFVRAWKLRRLALHANDSFVLNFTSAMLVSLAFIVLTTAIQDTFLYVRVWVFFGIALLLDRRILLPEAGK